MSFSETQKAGCQYCVFAALGLSLIICLAARSLEEQCLQLFFGEKEKTEKLLEYKYVNMLQIV